LVTAWRLAGWPIRRSPSLVKATIEGVVRAPSEFSITLGLPPSITATQLLVVPRSIPITLNEGTEEQMMRAVSVQGAESAMFHETSEWNGQMDMQELLQVPVPAGESVVFEQGGKHVMAFGIEEGLEPGGEVEVTLSFVRGDKVSFPVRLLAPGDDGSGDDSGN
jgi:hypothetical protein